MDNTLLKYLKLKSFKDYFEDFKKMDEQYNSGNLPKTDLERFFMSIKFVYNFYWRYIRQCYKWQGITIELPAHIFQKAKEDNLIKDADMWIDYIKALNLYYQASKKEDYVRIGIGIIKDFHNKIYSSLEFMQSKENIEFLNSYQKTAEEYSNEPLILADNEPVYNATEMAISERSYNILINYFKSNPHIKNVWLHGSKLYNTDVSGSDIDLLIDCPEIDFEYVLSGLSQLTIPYFIDCKNINSEEDTIQVKMLMKLGTKRIYKKDNDLVKKYTSKFVASLPEIEYTHWEDYYKDNYLPKYENMRSKASDLDLNNQELIDKIHEEFIDFFDTTCYLLKLYLINNGFVYIETKGVLGTAFRMGVLKYGEEFCIINDSIENNNNGKPYSKESMLNFVLKENFYIFEELNNELAVENE